MQGHTPLFTECFVSVDALIVELLLISAIYATAEPKGHLGKFLGLFPFIKMEASHGQNPNKALQQGLWSSCQALSLFLYLHLSFSLFPSPSLSQAFIFLGGGEEWRGEWGARIINPFM